MQTEQEGSVVAQPRSVRRFLARRYKANDLNGVMHAIGSLVNQQAADPHVIKLGRQIIAGAYDIYADPATGEQIPVLFFHNRAYHASTAPACFTRDDACELTALWDFCVMNVKYTLDPPHVDTYPDVRYILESYGEDCDGFTILLCSLAKAVGFDVGARVISQDGSAWQHIYPMIGIPKGHTAHYFPMDATEPGQPMGWEYPNPAARSDYRL